MKHVMQPVRVIITLVLALGVSLAHATLINFENVLGPSNFGNAASDYTITIDGYRVVVHGGTILTNASNAPADETSIYGTASFGSNTYLNPLSVSFFDAITNAPRNISNFLIDVLNGEPFNVNYTVADNIGNTSTVNVIPNTQSGLVTIGFAAAGNVVTIFGLPANGAFDFAVDNIRFNVPLHAPEPGSLALLALGMTALAFRRRFDRRS